jgi:hypothetical protein
LWNFRWQRSLIYFLFPHLSFSWTLTCYPVQSTDCHFL